MKKIILSMSLIFIAFHIYAIDGLLIKTIDYSFKEKWNNTVGVSVPTVSICETVYKKQYFFITVVAGDYAVDDKDFANVEYSIKITNPDNSVYFSQENLPLIKDKISNKKNLQMSEAVLKISFENKDAYGKYKIDVEITDRISGKSKALLSDLNLAPLPSYDQTLVKDDEDFLNWFQKYYQDQKPEEALAYYIYYSQSKLSDKESGFWPVFSVFLEIAKNNSFLSPQIIASYQNQDLKTKIYLLYLLSYSNIGTTEFFNTLEGDEKTAYEKIKDSQEIDIYGTVSDPTQLDILWGTFMASGSYQPILKLIQTLDYTKYQGDLDKFKSSQQTNEDRQKALNNAIYNSLVWSLKSNCKQHKLVREYCDWAVNYENLSSVQKVELTAILNENK